MIDYFHLRCPVCGKSGEIDVNASIWARVTEDLLCDLMHWADATNFDFDAALDRARHNYQAERDEESPTACLPEAVQDLIDALEDQTEAARAVIDSWQQGDLAGAVHGLEMSLDEALAALAKVKGGAA
jgi:hypothetical protein